MISISQQRGYFEFFGGNLRGYFEYFTPTNSDKVLITHIFMCDGFRYYCDMEKPLFASIPASDYARLKQLASANCMSLKAMLVKLIREAKLQ